MLQNTPLYFPSHKTLNRMQEVGPLKFSTVVDSNLALDGGEWLPSCPGYFTPEESTPLPTEETAGWAPEQVWKF